MYRFVASPVTWKGRMWFKHPAWIPIAWFLSLGNVAAVWFAAIPAEPLHATTHALLAVLFGVGAQRLMTRQRPAESGQDRERLDQLQQSVDVIALEVERMSEGQRFVTKVLGEKQGAPAELGAADPVAVRREET